MSQKNHKALFPNYHWIDAIYAFLKNNFAIIIPILFGIILRIPRIPHTRSTDTYILTSQSIYILQGQAPAWIVSPLSLFGLFPFSCYPIGSAVIMSFCLLIVAGNIDQATLLFNILMVIIGTITNTIFIREFFSDKRSLLLGNLIFVSIPVFLDFTYANISARIPFTVFAPIALTYMIRTYKTRSMTTFFYSFILVIFLMLFHRMAMIYLGFLAFLLFVIMIEKRTGYAFSPENENIESNNRRMKTKTLILLGALVLMFWVSFFLIPPEFVHDIPGTETLPWKYVIYFLNICTDYFIGLGPTIFLFLYGFLRFVSNALSKNSMPILNYDKYFFLLLFFLLLFVEIKNPHYLRYLMIPLMLPFIITAWNDISLKKMEIFCIFILLVLLSFYFNMFNLFWRPIFPYNILITLITVCFLASYLLFKLFNYSLTKRPKLSFFHHLESKISRTMIFLTFLGGVLFVHCYIQMDIISLIDIDNKFPYPYVSEEEIYIAEILKDLVSKHKDRPVLFFASRTKIELRIATHSGCLHLQDIRGLSWVLSGYVTQEDMIYNSSLLPVLNWTSSFYIFRHPDLPRGWRTGSWILESDFNSPSTQQMIDTLNIRYFVMEKNGNIANIYAGTFYSKFMETIDAPAIVETKHLILFQL